MPVVRGDKQEKDQIEQDTMESEKSSEDESESGSLDEDDSEMDEEECEKLRNAYMEEMADLERKFSELKEQLYKEKVRKYETKLEEAKAGRAPEYLKSLEQLQKNMSIRIQTAGVLREYQKLSIQNKYESEKIAAAQNLDSEKSLLYDNVKEEIEEKIRRLEEDRHNIDISSDLWQESQFKKNKKRSDFGNPERRKKPVTVAGPYIVYMLEDDDIIKDWTAIKKALKQNQKGKYDFEF